MKKAIYVSVGVFTAGAIIVTAVAQGGKAPASSTARDDSTQIAVGGSDVGSESRADELSPRRLTCRLDAVPELSDADPRLRELAAENGFSQRTNKVIAESAAVNLARTLSSDQQAAGSALTSAARVPLSWVGEANDLIAPDRCIWVVSVRAPFSPRSAPQGIEVPVHTSYTAFFDAASGEYIGVSAGPDSINLLSGANVPGRDRAATATR